MGTKINQFDHQMSNKGSTNTYCFRRTIASNLVSTLTYLPLMPLPPDIFDKFEPDLVTMLYLGYCPINSLVMVPLFHISQITKLLESYYATYTIITQYNRQYMLVCLLYHSHISTLTHNHTHTYIIIALYFQSTMLK